MNKCLEIAGHSFTSRLFVGTGKFQSNEAMKAAIVASGSQLVTVALKRLETGCDHDSLMEHITSVSGVTLMPNTSGARDAEEAIFAAHLAREAFQTDFIKVEVHPDPKYLLPDPIETLKTVEQLVKEGFIVLPYVQADPVLCKRIAEAGAAVVMPLGAPIGSNKGLRTKDFLQIIIEESQVPVVVDAGISTPSQAAEAMEMGADAVLINTAIAMARDSERMARAFAQAVVAGREAYEAGLPGVSNFAAATSPLQGFFDNRKDE